MCRHRIPYPFILATAVACVGDPTSNNDIDDPIDGESPLEWTVVAQGRSLRAVWGTSFDDVFVVGEPGVILHFDGSSWRVHESGTRASLNGVWGGSGTDVYVVGRQLDGTGLILHYDGTGWREMLAPIVAYKFGSIPILLLTLLKISCEFVFASSI